MGQNFTKRAKITWGAAFANTLNIAYPLDDWRSYSTFREGSEFAQSFSGIEDSWITGTDYVLEATVRWIPTSNTTTPLATGWDGATGFQSFLEWARQKNQFRYFPDTDAGTFYLSYLVEPLDGLHELEPDGTRSVRLKIRNTSGSFAGY